MQPTALSTAPSHSETQFPHYPLEKINHRSCNIVTWYIYTCICSHLSIILMYIIYTHTYVYLYIYIYWFTCLSSYIVLVAWKKTPSKPLTFYQENPPKTAPESIVQKVHERLHQFTRWFRWFRLGVSEPRVGRAKWPIHGVNQRHLQLTGTGNNPIYP